MALQRDFKMILVIVYAPVVAFINSRGSKKRGSLQGFRGLGVYLEVHCTYNLLNNCSYNPIISRVTIIMGRIFRL